MRRRVRIAVVVLGLNSAVVGFSHVRTFIRDFATTQLRASGETQSQISLDSFSRRALITGGSIASLALGVSTGRKNELLTGSTRASDEEWQGTMLPLLSLDDAYQHTQNDAIFPFAQWPDPILRRPASRLTLPSPEAESSFLSKIQSVALTLQRTAIEKGAVGLAAQQCGIDVSLVYLHTIKKAIGTQDKGLFLLNPRIVQRSPERDMLVWTEECLVLPPSFRATLLRDAEVTIEYETIFSLDDASTPPLSTERVTLTGEIGRAAQHEMQHDVGTLILDHVSLGDLPVYMQGNEAEWHRDRMAKAFDRSVFASSIPPRTSQLTAADSKLSWKDTSMLVPRANAAETTKCDESCTAERKRIIEERRAMMQQSRTNTRRQDIFELSQQRAALYNTTYQGLRCPPGIPCL